MLFRARSRVSRKLLAAVVAALVSLFACFGIVVVTVNRDRVSLAEGLQQLIDLTDATLAYAAPDREVAPWKENADIRLAAQLRNNHTFGDKSMDTEFGDEGAGMFNDCDSWKNILLDGWSASYGITLELRGDQDARVLLDKVMRFWHERGYTVTASKQTLGTNESEITELFFNWEHGGYSLTLDKAKKQARIGGYVTCLPAGDP